MTEKTDLKLTEGLAPIVRILIVATVILIDLVIMAYIILYLAAGM